MTRRKLEFEVDNLLKDWSDFNKELNFKRKKLLLIDVTNYMKRAKKLKEKILKTDRRYQSLANKVHIFIKKLEFLDSVIRQTGRGRKKTYKRRKSRRKTRKRKRSRKTRKRSRKRSRKTRKRSRKRSRKRRKRSRKSRRKTRKR